MKKLFKVGDLVFAKVKGYPAWPAKIISENGKKYQVTFFGTNERGSITVENLFYYLKHKEQFCKSLKRRDYIEAIEQIEAEIAENGTDGNVGNADDVEETEEKEKTKGRKRSRTNSSQESFVEDKTINEPEEANKSFPQSVSRSGRVIKVKRYSFEDNEEEEKRTKRRKSSQESQSSNQSKEEKLETLDITQDIDEKSKAKEEKLETKLDAKEEIATIDKGNENIESNDITDTAKNESREQIEKEQVVEVNVLPDHYLDAAVAYSEHVKTNSSIYKQKPMEPCDTLENSVVLTKLPSGETIGVRFPSSNFFNSEYDKAIDIGFNAKETLQLKEALEKGNVEPEEKSDLIVRNVRESSMPTRTHDRLNHLKVEANLYQCDSKIRGCLGLDKAEPKKALEYLDIMLGLDITPLMLKKHPLIVDMVKRLKKYVGNAKEWNLQGEALEVFEADAAQIRLKAEEIYVKFKSLFKVPQNGLFTEVFNSAVDEFKKNTKNMLEKDIFALCAEPNSRQAFFDSYEIKMQSADDNKEKKEHVEGENKMETEEKENENDEKNLEDGNEKMEQTEYKTEEVEEKREEKEEKNEEKVKNDEKNEKNEDNDDKNEKENPAAVKTAHQDVENVSVQNTDAIEDCEEGRPNCTEDE